MCNARYNSFGYKSNRVIKTDSEIELAEDLQLNLNKLKALAAINKHHYFLYKKRAIILAHANTTFIFQFMCLLFIQRDVTSEPDVI